MNLNLHFRHGCNRHALHKFLLVMKLIVLLLTAAIMQVSASSFAQKITLRKTNAPLEQIINDIRTQSGYDFLYNNRLLKNTHPVTIDVQDASIEEVLEICFADQPLTYKLEEKAVWLREKAKSNTKKVPLLQDTIRGTVTDSLGNPLAGVSVRIIGTNRGTNTNSQGRFQFNEIPANARLSFHSLGYSDREMAPLPDMTVRLSAALGELSEVKVSSGYQALPRERATGSFSHVDNELFNRPVSTDVMARIADVMPGVIFNKGVGGAAGLVIRGQTSINSITSQPLIIVDNFPYERDISNINPNDVESVTVLKDAAAASIWGARAGNGVIVITTKQGSYAQKPQISFNSNVTIGNKPNLRYHPVMSTSDFIDNEIRLYGENFYFFGEANLFGLHYPLTPVVELQVAKKNGTIDTTAANALVDSWRNLDVRNDYERYLYRSSANQQYALNLSGGTPQQRYFLSLGYDKNLSNEVGNGYERLSLNANNTYSFLKNRMELNTAVYYTQSNTDNNFIGLPTYFSQMGAPGTTMYPYAQFADAEGNALPLMGRYRLPFMETTRQQGLLDWQYRPLDEINLADNTTRSTDYRVNGRLKYTIIQGLSAEALYQYSRNLINGRNHYAPESYYARDVVNQFTGINATTGALTRAVPSGGILDRQNDDVYAHNFRAQINLQRDFGTLHHINAIAGYEIRDQRSLGSRTRLYGYDDEHVASQAVDYVTLHPTAFSSTYRLRITNMDQQTNRTDRFVSYYSNVGYTYRDRYLLSGSLRFDQSNIFGVRTNQKGVPLYSVGAGWTINQEDFYRVAWLPYLKLRATYGRGGNVNRNLSALTTATYASTVDPLSGLPYANLSNPPNPDLRWEQVNTLNFGLDYGMFNHRLNGSIEYYTKKGYDIIGTSPYASQTGITTFTGNYANTEAKGWDIQLISKNLTGSFQWDTDLQFSYVSDLVTKYILPTTVNSFSLLSSSLGTARLPYEGKPLFALYSYRWAGLDPENGDPMGYLNGEISKDWQAIYNEASTSNNIENLNYHGTARPKIFGAFRNTFTYKGLSLSANISYRFDYYFRRNSINFSDLSQGYLAHGDYYNRWLNPGDEQTKNIPSAINLTNSYRSGFYTLSEILVERGDHIRLQDINFSYTIRREQFRAFPFHSIQVYLYANNLGILWKATDAYEDPDYYRSQFPPVRTFAFGMNLTL